jgi:hypothetical protein
MILVRAITILMLFCSSVIAKNPAITESQRKTLLRDWKSVRFGIYVDMIDYASRGPTILLQRLDSKQAVLSVIPSGAGGEPWPMPIAIALIADADAVQLIEQALKFYSSARLETPPPKSIQPDRVRLFLDFATDSYRTNGRGQGYRADFDSRVGTLGRFHQFIQDTAKLPRN